MFTSARIRRPHVAVVCVLLCALAAVLWWQLRGDAPASVSLTDRGDEVAPTRSPDPARTPTRLGNEADPKSSGARQRLEAPPRDIVVRVLRDDGEPAEDAAVYVTRERLRRAPETLDAAWKQDFAAVAVGTTDAAGEFVVPRAARSAVCHVWVEDRHGILAKGPGTLDVAREYAEPLVFTVASVRAAAFTMSDGVTIDHSRWAFESIYRLGMQSQSIRKLREGLQARLSLGYGQVFVGAAAVAAAATMRSKVAIFHPKIGWFHREIPLSRLDDVVPIEITPPAKGAGTPVRVVVDCVAPDGAKRALAGVRLHGQGGVDGFPRIVASGETGEPMVVPAGDYMIQFADTALIKAFDGPRVVELKKDQRVELKLRWTARDVNLTVVRDGEPVRGAATVLATVGRLQLYRRRYLDVRDGKLSASVPNEKASKLTIRIDGEVAVLELKPGDERTEYRITLQ